MNCRSYEKIRQHVARSGVTKTYSKGAERAGAITDITRTSVVMRDACIVLDCVSTGIGWDIEGSSLQVEQKICELHTRALATWTGRPMNMLTNQYCCSARTQK